MGKFFENFFIPLVHIQNDLRVTVIILWYVCWGAPLPPPYIPQNSRTRLRVTHWPAAAPVLQVR